MSASGMFGMKAGDAVAGLHAQRAQRLRKLRHLVVELGEGEPAAHLVLAPEHDRGLAVAPAQQVLGEVEARSREPARAGHAVGVDQVGRRSPCRRSRRRSPRSTARTAPAPGSTSRRARRGRSRPRCQRWFTSADEAGQVGLRMRSGEGCQSRVGVLQSCIDPKISTQRRKERRGKESAARLNAECDPLCAGGPASAQLADFFASFAPLRCGSVTIPGASAGTGSRRGCSGCR